MCARIEVVGHVINLGGKFEFEPTGVEVWLTCMFSSRRCHHGKFATAGGVAGSAGSRKVAPLVLQWWSIGVEPLLANYPF